MKRQAFLRLVLGLLLAVIVPLIVGATTTDAGQQTAEPTISVSRNVWVSTANAQKHHDEVLIAADPSSSARLIACSILYGRDGKSSTIAYASFDGGKHWQPAVRSNPQFLFDGDPACAYGLNGQAYFADLGTPSSKDGDFGMFFHASLDGGKHWRPEVRLPSVDREYITVDTSDSHYRNRVYLNATFGSRGIDHAGSPLDEQVNGIGIFRSADGGRSFSGLAKFLDDKNQYVLGMGNGATLSDGTFVALFGDLKDATTGWSITPGTATARLKALVSPSGGKYFNKAIVVDDWEYCNLDQSSDIPIIAADTSRGTFRDRLYAVWPDRRSGRCEIELSYSRDKGATWSPALTLNDDFPRQRGGTLGNNNAGGGPDEGMPVVAVNRDGVVAVMWYDRRDNPDDNGYYVRFAASVDGGQTFTPSVRISESAMNLAQPVQHLTATYAGNPWLGAKHKDVSGSIGFSGFDFTGGHTAGLAASPDALFHALWVDNRTGFHQVWTASIRVGGRALKYGSTSLSSLDDVTQKLAVDLSQPAYDPATNTFSVLAQLANNSQRAVRGPIAARVIRLSSSVGPVTVIGSDNGINRAGAVWNFEHELPNGSLAPNERSAPKKLQFFVPRASSTSAKTGFRSSACLALCAGLVHFEAQLLAPPKASNGAAQKP